MNKHHKFTAAASFGCDMWQHRVTPSSQTPAVRQGCGQDHLNWDKSHDQDQSVSRLRQDQDWVWKCSWCWSALNMHSFYWPAGGDLTGSKSNCMLAYEEMSRLLTRLETVYTLLPLSSSLISPPPRSSIHPCHLLTTVVPVLSVFFCTNIIPSTPHHCFCFPVVLCLLLSLFAICVPISVSDFGSLKSAI